ncbi:MAG: TM2 domain-containing protein [Bacteroidetes bacterium]|nr:TM2 domain-containing protein [Bacteroidota bacterium]
MANILLQMPFLEGEELLYVQELIKDFDESRAQQFASVYSSRRKDPTTIMILTLLGLLGIAGIQRFILDQIGMGILYFLTAGLCLIGTIIDLVNYRKLAFEYNSRQAQQVASLVKNFSQN